MKKFTAKISENVLNVMTGIENVKDFVGQTVHLTTGKYPDDEPEELCGFLPGENHIEHDEWYWEKSWLEDLVEVPDGSPAHVQESNNEN